MSSRSHLLLTVLALALLACGAPTDSTPAVVESGPARSSADLLNNQDMMLRHCVESEVARGNISRPEGDTTLGRISTTRNPSDLFRLGLLTQCIEAVISTTSQRRTSQISPLRRLPLRQPRACPLLPERYRRQRLLLRRRQTRCRQS